MRRNGTILVVLGLLLAVLSFLGVFSVLKKQTATVVATPVPTVKVVVASQTVPERTTLQSGMVTVKDWPIELVPVGAVHQPQDVVGKITSGSLAVGEPVLTSKFSMEAQAVGLAPMLPPGLVVVVISLAPASAVGGAVQAGDSIDVLVSTEYSEYSAGGDESKQMQATFYTIQDVPVLAVSGNLDIASAATTGGLGGSASTSHSSGASPIMMTVLVTPQDALFLKYAREKGTIDVALRSPEFHEQVVTDPVYLDYIVRRFDLPHPVMIVKAAADTGEPK